MIDPLERSDEELMMDARAGSVESFETLVSRHRASVARFLVGMHPDLDLAEDACQEAFLRLWIHREKYEPSGKFSAYLLQIAKNVLISRLRGRRMTELEMPEEVPESADAQVCQSPESALMQAERNADAIRCIDALPVHLGEVFRVVVVDGMKYAEAAELLDIPLGTVKSRMHEAVKRLRAALSERSWHEHSRDPEGTSGR